jgi:predicted dehydrogenase
MKILIAGLGSIGRRHLKNLIALGEHDIFLYRTGHSTLPDEELKEFPVFTNLETALSHSPQAVIISNPTALHLEVAIPAAKAGCHILLEKPVSHSLDYIDEFRSAVTFNKVKLLVGYQFRFHPGLQAVRRLIEEGAIGRIISVHAHWGEYLPDWHPWENFRQGYSARTDLGGGVILTLSHPFDYLCWLAGDVAQVWAFTSRSQELELDVEDTAEIGLRFLSGALGSLHLDYHQQPADHHLVIVGVNGTIEWNYADGTTRVYRVKDREWKTYPLPGGFERNDMFLAQMRHFLEVVKGNVEPTCTFEDGVEALQIVLAAQESQKLGEAIQLPLPIH